MRGFAGDWAIGETTKKVESKQRSQMGIVSCGDSTACVNVIASLKRGMINTIESIYNLKVHPKISVSIEVLLLLLNNVNYMIQINIISFQILWSILFYFLQILYFFFSFLVFPCHLLGTMVRRKVREKFQLMYVWHMYSISIDTRPFDRKSQIQKQTFFMNKLVSIFLVEL